MKKLFLQSSGLCLIAIATLLTPSVNATKWECGERSNLPLEGKNYCAAGDFRQSEINLAKVLNALIEKHKIALDDTSILINAQRDFESDRDKQCATENKRTEDKPYHPMIVAQCKTRLTNLRIAELKRMQQQD